MGGMGGLPRHREGKGWGRERAFEWLRRWDFDVVGVGVKAHGWFVRVPAVSDAGAVATTVQKPVVGTHHWSVSRRQNVRTSDRTHQNVRTENPLHSCLVRHWQFQERPVYMLYSAVSFPTGQRLHISKQRN